MDIEKVLKEFDLEKAPCPILWTKNHLRFYELGAFLQWGDHSWIELNPKKFGSFWGYSQETVLRHELVHALRRNFEDSFWEELIAYQTSKKSYQKFLGPFFSKRTNQVLLIFLSQGVWLKMIMPFTGPLMGFLFVSSMVRSFLEYRSFKKVLRGFLEKGFSQKESFLKIVQLSKDELNALVKKSAPRVRDF